MSSVDVQEYGMAPGNWLALEIRRFQEQSKGLFPAPQPGDEKIRYNTIYGIDFAPLAKEMYKADTPVLLKRPGIKKETPFSLEQAKRFNSWKVRKDLVEVDKVQQRVSERRKTALEMAKREEDNLAFPSIQRSQTVAPPAVAERKKADKKSKYDVKTPVLPPGPQLSRPSAQSVCGSFRGERHVDTRQSLPGALPSNRTGRYQDIKQDLLEAAEQYMQKSPHADRRVIDKALQTSNKHYRADPGALSTELPNPKQEAEKWLEQATEDEQRIALKFFRSVGGMKLMGQGGKNEHQKRLEDLLSALESGEAKVPVPRLSYADEQRRRERKQRNLQFVRLLSPKTRKARPEHQSWHHLPLYRPLNRADNVRSHYTQPQKVKPLHFTIHPDWGP